MVCIVAVIEAGYCRLTQQEIAMSARALTAEFIGTFMLVASLFGTGLYGVMGAIGVALAVGVVAVALTASIGAVSGGHYNPAVTIGLMAGGRFQAIDALGYIVAQCLGAVVAGAMFVYVVGTGKSATLLGVANGFDALSPNKSGMVAVFAIEFVLTAFLLMVVMGATGKKAPAGFAAIAIGLALAGIHLISIPVSNTSVNPARSLAAALWAGPTAMSQLWLFWVAPLLGGLTGGLIGRWFAED
jgi:aquaporin Z